MKVLYTVLLLIGSNLFMTTAWYYHLKKPDWSLWAAIGLSWLIALPEYCLQVPANRIGHVQFGGPLSAVHLKIIQEAITLIVFSGFSILVLRERLRWTDLLACVLVFAAVAISVLGRHTSTPSAEPVA